MDKKIAIQTISWFYDLFNRELLDLDPPYQRKSVWNQKYKDYYIDTLIMNYPCPAVFLYEEINDEGLAKYYVVDGKQRLTTIFDFINNRFPVGEITKNTALRGKFFRDLSSELKVQFYRYNLSVEYLMTNDETIIHDIFERINKNIAKLTPQELRHARLDGDFIKAAESINEWMTEILPPNIPRIARSSINQMKDVEYTSQLLLLIECGANGYLQHELDEEYTTRDIAWTRKDEVIEKFKTITYYIKELVEANDDLLISSRIKNQADLYAIFGAINSNLHRRIDFIHTSQQLSEFYRLVDQEEFEDNSDIEEYYDSIRSNVNQGSVRQLRIDLVEKYFVFEA